MCSRCRVSGNKRADGIGNGGLRRNFCLFVLLGSIVGTVVPLDRKINLRRRHATHIAARTIFQIAFGGIVLAGNLKALCEMTGVLEEFKFRFKHLV